MTREPMRLPARAPRVPGFPGSPEERLESTAIDDGVDWSAPGTRQVNMRLRVPLHRRARAFIRALEDEGFETSFTELVQALLYSSPPDTREAKELIRAWQRAVVG